MYQILKKVHDSKEVKKKPLQQKYIQGDMALKGKCTIYNSVGFISAPLEMQI